MKQGTQIGRFQIEERLGSSFVYRARDVRSGILVALKILPAWRRSEETLARFKRELQVETQIHHPAIATFVDAGLDYTTDPELVGSAGDQRGGAKVAYFAREFIDGTPLDEAITQRPLSIAAALNVAIQVARGLVALHERGVVHRNLNPRNLVLDRHLDVKMVDFGMVKILQSEAQKTARFETSTGHAIGTAGYMAPEQVRGGAIDGRTDLFALGVVLYQLVSQRRPFPTDNLLDYFHALNHADPPLLRDLVPEAPSELDGIVRRLLAKDPSQRYQNARAVVPDLERCLRAPGV